MAKQIFTWIPTSDWLEDQKPIVDVIKFGDGYEQRIERGINSSSSKVNVSFVSTITEIAAIKAFLESHNAAESFDWTTPLSANGYFVARSWKVSRVNEATLKLSAVFEQVFE